jgi:hypothetical protein
MAIVKSDVMIDALNLDTQAERGLGSCVRGSSGVVATGGALANNDVLVFFEVPVDALIDSVILASDDLGTTGDINVGMYPGLTELKRLGKLDATGTLSITDADAVDEDALGSAIDVNAAAVAPTEIRYETKGIETINQKAWELAGLSSRPAYENFLIGVTLSEASTAAGDVTLLVKHRL